MGEKGSVNTDPFFIFYKEIAMIFVYILCIAIPWGIARHFTPEAKRNDLDLKFGFVVFVALVVLAALSYIF
jgi:hypothetical protein